MANSKRTVYMCHNYFPAIFDRIPTDNMPAKRKHPKATKEEIGEGDTGAVVNKKAKAKPVSKDLKLTLEYWSVLLKIFYDNDYGKAITDTDRLIKFYCCWILSTKMFRKLYIRMKINIIPQ